MNWIVNHNSFSVSIVLWELLSRTVTGIYANPYDSYGYQMQMQILIGVNNGIRPPIPSNTPVMLDEMLKCVGAQDPKDRPSSAELITKLLTAFEEYKAHREEWDKILPKPVPSNKELLSTSQHHSQT